MNSCYIFFRRNLKCNKLNHGVVKITNEYSFRHMGCFRSGRKERKITLISQKKLKLILIDSPLNCATQFYATNTAGVTLTHSNLQGTKLSLSWIKI